MGDRMFDFLKRLLSGRRPKKPPQLPPPLPPGFLVQSPIAAPVPPVKKKRTSKAKKEKKPKPPRKPTCRYFHNKVAGASYDNEDGSSRQKIIKKLVVGEQLTPVHDPNNKHDKYAVMLVRQNRQQVGWLFSELAQQVMEEEKKGYRFVFFVSDITGREHGTLGVNLLIFQSEPGVPDEEFQQYMRDRL
jgi:hypothetical protein